MSGEAFQQQVLDTLESLHNEDSFNKLFTSLGYSFIRRSNQQIASNSWTEPAREALSETPRKVFRAGADGEFGVVYCRLKGDKLLVGQERRVISQLQGKNNLARSLFVFSNEGQDRWHFVNVRQEADEERRSLQRRITIGPEERLRTASERISELRLGPEAADLPGIEIQGIHNEAFDVEQVTKKFFDDYTKVYFDLQDDLIEQTGDRRWAHDYSLQLVNRMMFLYFIQRKRWLGDDPEFMKRFWNAYRVSETPEDSFFRDWLKVLFFESFNGRFHGGHRHFPTEIREVLATAPYLNGGLFTENDLDQQYSFQISDSRFETILDLLEHYNFTISEDSPLDQEVAVDPEMIGKVYESLVNVEEESADERSAAGIFYTPRTEIDLMCRLTLVDHLANHLGEDRKNLLYEVVFAIEPEYKDDADRQVASEGLWTELDDRLQEVTVVDPACGSGSFLVGMLQVLDDLQERASRQLGREEESYDRRKRIIGQSLYGVDVMDWAVRVAELRLWLSLIIETELSRDELHVREEPLLPHFTFKLRPGDGLVQEVGGINLGHMRSDLSTSPTLKRRITTLKTEKLKFYNNDPERKFSTADQLQQEERRLFLEILDARRREIQNRIADLNNRIANPAEELQLEGMSDSTPSQPDLNTVALEKEVGTLQEDLDRTTSARQAIRPDTPVPFVWDIAFVEIFEGEDRGFDIVVGNPPYVQQESIADPRLRPEEVTTTNRKEYKAKLARSVYQTFPEFFRYNQASGKAALELDVRSDLYLYFYFHGLSLLNRTGSFSFITTNAWLDVDYGKELQEFLLKRCRVKMVLDNTRRSFASAAVNTVITLFSPPDEGRDSSSSNTARFVTFAVPFEHILDPVIFEEIEDAQERSTTAEYKVRPLTHEQLLIEGTESTNGDRIETTDYAGNKWGGKYLRSPDIYWTIFERARDKLVRLDYVTEVRFGIKTNANDFFYLDKESVEEWGIESRFLRPVVKGPKECKKIVLDSRDTKYQLFACSDDKNTLAGTAALEYIRWGESKRYNQRAALSGKPRWYDLTVGSWPTQVWIKAVNDRHLQSRIPFQAFVDQRLYKMTYTDDPERLNVVLNSALTMLFKELYGRVNLGEGVLDTAVYEANQLPILDPRTLPVEDAQRVESQLASRNIKPVGEELYTEEHRALDDMIFDVLELTQGERDAVYEAVIDLVDTRLKKAKSLGQ